MKKIGILGCTGEIGSKLLETLKDKFALKAAFHKKSPSIKWINVEYSQFDVYDKNKLIIFIQECYIIVNCAGSSFINGTYIAQCCSHYGVIYIDPFGANFLENEIARLNLKGTFVLSSGCFPGLCGIAMRHMCESYEKVNSISGICIDKQIPGLNGVVDFIISGLKEFGEASYYYDGTKRYDNEKEIFRDFDGNGVEVQKYYTTEIADIVKRYSIQKAIWYTPVLSKEITEVMQKAIIEYIQTKRYDSLYRYAKKVQDMITDNSDQAMKSDCEINICATGIVSGEYNKRNIVIKSMCGSLSTAAVLNTVLIKLMKEMCEPGVYYATDIVSLSDILANNDSTILQIYSNDDSVNVNGRGIVYEEGCL